MVLATRCSSGTPKFKEKKRNRLLSKHWILQLFFNFLSDHISLHVRTLGDWTQRLHDYFQRSQNRRRSICESFSPTKKPTKKLPNMDEELDDDDDDGELRPPLTKLSKDSLHRRVQFRTPEKEPDTPETKPRMTFPNKKRANFPMEAIRLSVSENIPSCSPVDRNSNSVRRNPADVQIDIAPQTRVSETFNAYCSKGIRMVRC